MFTSHHIGATEADIEKMLQTIGVDSLDTLIEKTIPKNIRLEEPLDIPDALDESEMLNYLKDLGSDNKQFKSFIGQGYYGTLPLSVVVRNILENPAWYTSYTPYQAEISQGRLEALINYQTMIVDLTGMEIANASLLDEATAVAEAMIMMYNARSRAAIKSGVNKLFVDTDMFRQTKEVVKTRARLLGIELVFGKYDNIDIDNTFFGAIVQYPSACGEIIDYKSFVEKVHSVGALVSVAADLLSLAILTPPGEWGADIVCGSIQRFGLPMANGGPHAGYFATRDSLKRSMPGRIVGVSVDSQGDKALRLALQTREQHIKRERATSNICTAQALMAIMSGIYAQYHGAEGIRQIALKINLMANNIDLALQEMGYEQLNKNYFDTLCIKIPDTVSINDIRKLAEAQGINFFYPKSNIVMLSTDEATTDEDIENIILIFAKSCQCSLKELHLECEFPSFDNNFLRKSDFLTSDIFNKFHSELAITRYIKSLEVKDYSMATGMIPLGSCTMKLNSATSMFAMSWSSFGNIHPFAPVEQKAGYEELILNLAENLMAITGFSDYSFQPNSGAAGEYAGLATIRAYFIDKGQSDRDIILIPASAHGTNPASAAAAGCQVVVVDCDENGNIDVDDFCNKADKYADHLVGTMITYPSTHGVFEEAITTIIDKTHSCGGLVYMDGANMNAQVGLTSPARIGADICHLNLHKTFGLPHGGGGPGVGPILCTEELAEYLPGYISDDTFDELDSDIFSGAISAAANGSAHLLTIAFAYINMLGNMGITMATKIAILNANYIAAALKDDYKTLYVGKNGFVGHELILDCREFKATAEISETDIAKRLMDYGFHAPTLSFPVHGTLMIEPTESEPLAELDRFIEAMKSIRREIDEIVTGKQDIKDNVLKNAPHTAAMIGNDQWEHPYSRSKAVYPTQFTRNNKFWPSVARVDDGYGDRNLVTTI